MVVPGSGLVRAQAEEEGLAQIFIDAGFEWREPGCSMCLGMNPDQLKPRERCASTSNRNFKGRQGSATGRTLLMSPAMVATAAVRGHVADVRRLLAEPACRCITLFGPGGAGQLAGAAAGAGDDGLPNNGGDGLMKTRNL